jgi:hypothetical protein
MKEITTSIKIETAKNGFLVFINDYPSAMAIRPLPYVFETMENMQKFIKEQFENNK